MTGDIGIRSNKYVMSGKMYCELKIEAGQNAMIGVANDILNIKSERGNSINLLTYYSDGMIYPSARSCGSTYQIGDVIGIAIDIDSKKIKFAKNATWFNDIDLPIWNKYFIYLTSGSSWGGDICTINFWDTSFKYNPPTGYSGFGNENKSISLDNSSLNLNVGDSQQLTT